MPTVSIRFYAPLGERLGLSQGSGRASLDLVIEPDESLRKLFCRLAERHPAFYGVLLEPETTELLPHVTLLINGQRLTLPEDYDAPLEDGAEIVVLPIYAGG